MDIENQNESTNADSATNLISTINTANTSIVTRNINLDEPYIDSRKIIIKKKESTSNYFQKNAIYMPERRRQICPSINATTKIMASTGELEAYMPQVIGVSKTHSEFYTRCTNYFNSIMREVPDAGLVLDCTFRFSTKLYYDNYNREFEKIQDILKNSNISTPEDRNNAFDKRDNSLIKLESEQYKYGIPIVASDYILYRYCLVSSSIASALQLINRNGDISLYIVDSRLDNILKNQTFQVKDKALTIYSELRNNPQNLTNVLFCLGNYDADSISTNDKLQELSNIIENNPLGLLDVYGDKRLSDKAFINRLVASGVLRKLPNSNMFMNTDDEVIANNIDEMINYTINPVNSGIINSWRIKLNNSYK